MNAQEFTKTPQTLDSVYTAFLYVGYKKINLERGLFYPKYNYTVRRIRGLVDKATPCNNPSLPEKIIETFR
jgi:hypothetical protein